MNLVFFQNCVSPHQVPYIKELCRDKRVGNVCLAVPRVDYRQRVSMGWGSRRLLDGTSVKFFLSPSDDEVKRLLMAKDTYALFSGIRADKDVFRWLKLSLRFDVKRGIITEAPNVYALKPLFLHRLRFLLQDYRFVKHIHYVFAFGDMATRYYCFWSKRWRVVPFSYCTEMASLNGGMCENVSDRTRLLYVGTVNKNKNVGSVLELLAERFDGMTDFHIIGDGPERKRLEAYVQKRRVGNVVFHGRMDMAKVHALMSGFDALVLPSRYDGWGAVVNEALQCGLYVICSDKCGAKDLLVNERLGRVFHSRKSLEACLSEAVNNVSAIRKGREYRKSWAECISGRTLAKYFVDSLLAVGDAVPPWKVGLGY